MVGFRAWLVLASCGRDDADAREACDALLSCASVVNPFLLEDLEGAYGEEGTCWATSDDPSSCADACENALTGLWVEFDHPDECDPSAFVESGNLTVAQFFDAFATAYCDTLNACNEGVPCADDFDYNPLGDADRCEGYDPAAADLCLGEALTCRDTYPGFEYPVVPSICEEVCE